MAGWGQIKQIFPFNDNIRELEDTAKKWFRDNLNEYLSNIAIEDKSTDILSILNISTEWDRNYQTTSRIYANITIHIKTQFKQRATIAVEYNYGALDTPIFFNSRHYEYDKWLTIFSLIDLNEKTLTIGNKVEGHL